MRRPAIIYVEESTDSFQNSNIYKKAMDFYLKNEIGADVISYENFWRLEADCQRVARLIKQGALALIIFKESRWDDSHYSQLLFIRKISKDVLIWLQQDYRTEFSFENKDNDPRILYGREDDVLEKIADYLKDWQIPETWFGADSEYEEHLLMERLEESYNRWFNEDDSLAVSDYNHKVVAEALRLRLLPPAFIGDHLGEFDKSILLKIQGINISPEFDKDVKKIRQMNNEERDSFLELLTKECNSPDRISWGRNVLGFAIDPITLEIELVDNYGGHAFARDHLSYRLDEIASLSKKYFYHDEHSREVFDDYRYYCLARILPGLVFKRVRGLKSPVVKIFVNDSRISDEYLNQALKYLMNLKKIIPVDVHGNILDGS